MQRFAALKCWNASSLHGSYNCELCRRTIAKQVAKKNSKCKRVVLREANINHPVDLLVRDGRFM